MNISISERAKQELVKLEVGGMNFLRVSVIQGGCSGMTYDASIDSTLSENDITIYEEEGLRAVADEGSTMFLDGLEIGYSDDLVTSGFRFKNPKATKACGCGSSFKM
ncbi:MAG: iron-sulfur cluster assembly accessory protein [Kiritimatiellae bacterium]|nr:iron-sulfur cluster assembly accessory protein [Kiritimatiellia bacterium]